MMLHTITNQMLGWFVRRSGYRDDCLGFGHIDLGDFDCTKLLQVVERVVNEIEGTYWISVVGGFDTIEEAKNEIKLRRDYLWDYTAGCDADYEVWYFRPYRYRWYYGDDFYIGNELPLCICSTYVLNECGTEYFDDVEECAEYVAQLFKEGYRLFDARVENAEISYLDTLDFKSFGPSRVLSVPLHVQVFTK